jgi:subtilase family serine protease
VDIIRNWLLSKGFTVHYIYPTRMVIDFSGTAGDIKAAFHTEIHNLEVNGKAH